jgi:protein TonB
MATYPLDNNATAGHDRLGFALCLAIALHAAIILGISFKQLERTQSAPRLEITLAQYRSDNGPQQADYLAQYNQQGSGSLKEKQLITSQQDALFHDANTNITSPQQSLSRPEQQRQRSRLQSTSNRLKLSQQHSTEAETAQESELGPQQLEKLNEQIASLQARLDIQNQAYAKRPRIRRLTSVAARQSLDALYLHHWRNKIEQIGNRNYPAAARRDNIYGELRLLVALLPNGDVHRVRVLSSSGHKVLDEAAIRIVHLAAPYQPFPHDMASKVDVLEIIRTWRFEKNLLTSKS